MNNVNIGHGFVAPEAIQPEEYTFGALPQTVIQEDGRWLPFIPLGEVQARKGFDTFGCTAYNTLNALEILEYKLYGFYLHGIRPNYAERPPYIGVGIKPPGSNPHLVSEWIRNNGLCKEESLPFDDTIYSLERYVQPNPLSANLVTEGKDWLKKNTYQHEWVVLPSNDLAEKQRRMMKSLQLSPLGVAVQAWQERNGLYYQDGEVTHWTVLVGYKKDAYWIIFDSYKEDNEEIIAQNMKEFNMSHDDVLFIKRMEWNTDFGFVKRYLLEKSMPEEQKKSLQDSLSTLTVILNSLLVWLKKTFPGSYPNA